MDNFLNRLKKIPINIRLYILDSLSRIFGTRQYKYRINRIIVDDIHKKCQLFDNLYTIEDSNKRDYRKVIKDHEKLITSKKTWWNEAKKSISLNIYWGGLFLTLISLPIVSYFFLNSEYKIDSFLFFVIASALFGFFMAALALIPTVIILLFSSRLLKNIGFDVVRMFSLVALLPVLLMYISFIQQIRVTVKSEIVTQVGFSGLLSAVIWLSLIIVLFGLNELVSYLRAKWIANSYPDSLIIDTLLTILSKVESENGQWINLNFRKEIVVLLGDVSILVSQNIPVRLKSGEFVTDSWVRSTTEKIGASINSLKKWVLTPKNDTKNNFKIRIANMLLSFTSGNWDELEKIEPVRITRSDKIKQISVVIRSFLGAILPATSFWLIQQTPIAIEGIISDYVSIGTLLWATITILSLLDPLFKEKVSTLKDISPLLPFGKFDDN